MGVVPGSLSLIIVIAWNNNVHGHFVWLVMRSTTSSGVSTAAFLILCFEVGSVFIEFKVVVSLS